MFSQVPGFRIFNIPGICVDLSGNPEIHPGMKKLLLLLVSIYVLNPANHAQDPPDSLFTRIGYVTSLESDHLEQVRRLFIHLPDNHDPEKTYPLVIVLDGEATFRAFASATALMAWQKLIPECIVVGVPNINRELDYAPVIEGIPGSGSAGKMTAFYREELFPYLEKQFGVGEKVLYGHSWVGFFATWVMLTDPGLFDAYISSSPMFRFFDRIFKPDGIFDRMETEPVDYFLTLGGEETMSRELEGYVSLLEEHAPGSINWRFVLNEGKNHDTNALSSYMDGLMFVFAEGVIPKGQ